MLPRVRNDGLHAGAVPTDAGRGSISRRSYSRGAGLDRAVHGGSNPFPYGRIVDLPRRAEPVAGRASPRVGCDADNAVSGFREGGGSRSRLAGRRAFIRAPADRLPDGPVRAGSACPAVRGRLRKPMGPALFVLSLVRKEGSQ